MPEPSELSEPAASPAPPASLGRPILSVRGLCRLEVPPDLAVVTVTAIARGTDRAETTEQLASRHAAVQQVVVSLGGAVEESHTSPLSVHVQLAERRKEKEQVRRFVGRAPTEVTVNDFDVLSRLITDVGEIDLVQVDGPAWQLRRDNDVYRRVRIGAAADAHRRARDYAEAFGARVTGLVEISDIGLMSSGPELAHATASMKTARFHGPGGKQPPRFDLTPDRQWVTGELEVRFTMSQPDLDALDHAGA